MPRHTGYSDAINLTISLCLTYVLCVSAARIWMRRRGFGADDAAVVVATTISFGHTAADYIAMDNGLGTSWERIVNNANLPLLNAASIAGIISWVIALYMSKCAMIFFLCRLSCCFSKWKIYHICNALTAILGLISILAVTVVDCTSGSDYYWAFHNHSVRDCAIQTTRWQILTAFDVVTEIVLLVLPVNLVAKCELELYKKLVIIAWYYLRLPLIGLSIARNHYVLKLGHPETDAGLDSGLVVIWLEVQLAYALAACTLSTSVMFTLKFTNDLGLGFAHGEVEDDYGLSDVSGRAAGPYNGKVSKLDPAFADSIAPWTRSRTPGTIPKNRSVMDRSVSPLPPHQPRSTPHTHLATDGEAQYSHTRV